MFRIDQCEVTILGQKVVIDETKAVSLGFTSAGWQLQKQSLLESLQTVFTSGVNIIEPQLSYYKRQHDASVRKKKSINKRVDFKSVEKALEVVEGLLNKLSKASLKNLFNEFLSCYKMLPSDQADHLEHLDTAFEEYGELGAGTVLLQAGVAYFLDPPVHQVENEEIVFHGYHFVRFMTSMKELESQLIAEDKRFVKEILEWSSYVNLAHTGEEIQAVITNAKATIVDWLQVNLTALLEGKPLTPIYFVIEQAGDKPFKPNWDIIIKKVRHSYTAAELRMIYRLGYEAGDELIKDIMQNLVIFCSYHPKEGFMRIDAPWLQNAETWMLRKRSNDRLAFFKRGDADNPKWLHELISLSGRAKMVMEENRAMMSTRANELK